MTDLSKLSDNELIALQSGDLSKISEGSLNHLMQQQAEQAQRQTQMTHSASSSTEQSKYADVPETLGDRAKNALYGAAMGAAAPVQGIGQLIMHGASALSGDGHASQALRANAKRFDDYLGRQENQYQSETAGSPTAGIGRFAASVAPFVMSGGTSSAAQAPLLASALRGAGTGALMSGLTPVNDVKYDESGGNTFAKDKAERAAISAALGGALTPVARGVARVIRPETSQDVQKLLAEKIRLTPGQILGGGFKANEEKMTSAPLVGDMIKDAQKRSIEDLNKSVYSRAMGQISEKTPDVAGREGVESVKDALSAKYNALLPNMSFKADQQFSQALAQINAKAATLPEPQANQFQKILRDVFVNKLSPAGEMNGTQLKGVESDLTRMARGYGGDQAFDNRNLGSAVGDLLSAMRESLTRSNPQYAEELAKINKGFANYAILRQAAGSLGADNGVFTPAQLQNAVKAADKSSGKGNFATGNAFMQDLSQPAKNVIGNVYPDSGTAGRNALLNALRSPLQAAKLAATGGAIALPYTKPGQKVAEYLLTRRPDIASPLADMTRGAGGVAGAEIQKQLADYLRSIGQ